MTPRRELKRYAKQAMSGKYGTIILAFVAVQALSLIGGMVSSSLFPGTETIDIVMGYAFSFILTLLINVISAGLNYMYLNIARERSYSLNDLIYFYKNHPDRVLIATFFLAVLNFLTMLPYTIYGNTAEIGDTIESQIAWLYTSILLMLVGVLVFQVLVIPLEMTYFILADKPDIKGTEALKESIEMMHGNFGRYLMLKISFIPLMFLSVFTFYIALLWILPYMEMTEVMFYRDLLGELTAQKEEEERAAQDYVNPMFGGQPQENQQNQQQFWSAPQEAAFNSYENGEEQNTADNEEMQSNVYSTDSKSSSDSSYDSDSVKVQTQTASDRAENQNDQADTVNKKEQNTLPAQEEEEDNEPKPWDEYFNSLK